MEIKHFLFLRILRRQIESFKSHKQLKEAITFPSKTNLCMTVPRGKGRAGRWSSFLYTSIFWVTGIKKNESTIFSSSSLVFSNIEIQIKYLSYNIVNTLKNVNQSQASDIEIKECYKFNTQMHHSCNKRKKTHWFPINKCDLMMINFWIFYKPDLVFVARPPFCCISSFYATFINQ